MKIAQVVYTGRMASNAYRVPGDGMHKAQTFAKGRFYSVKSLESAQWYEQKDAFEITWTVRGRVLRRLNNGYESVERLLAEMDYRPLQQLAKTFDIRANQSEEELEEALAPEIEQLQRQMENQ